jgi:maltose O-acetyltransferase
MSQPVAELPSLVRSFIVNSLLASVLVPSWRRVAWLRRCGLSIGERASIYSRCYFSATNITIGPESFVNAKCFFDNFDAITIGARTHLAMEVTLCTSSHELGPSTQRAGAHTPGAIRIGDGCWLGVRATVLPGVSIGDGCVIAAGALVTSDCEPNGIYAGVPARRIRDLDA